MNRYPGDYAISFPGEYACGPGFFIFFWETQIETGPGIIIYEQLPVKTVKRVIRRIKRLKKKHQFNPENVRKIADVMAEQWPVEEMQQYMRLHQIDMELAILSYKATLMLIMNDEDLALILILASL